MNVSLQGRVQADYMIREVTIHHQRRVLSFTPKRPVLTFQLHGRIILRKSYNMDLENR